MLGLGLRGLGYSRSVLGLGKPDAAYLGARQWASRRRLGKPARRHLGVP